MAFKLETAQPGGMPERLNRQGAQARQERWLAQLQDALFASDDGNASGPRGDSVPRSRADERRLGGARSDAADGQQAQADGKLQRKGKAQHAGNAAATAAAGTSLASLGAAAPSGYAPATLGAQAAALHGAAPAAAGQGAASAPAAVPQQASAASVPGLGLPAGAPAPVAQDGDAAAAQAQDGASAQPDLAPSADDTASGAAAAAPQEEYAARLLRLVPEGQGVHAWVRDASLQPGQVAAVAAALAGELAASGQPLAALSINGKRLPDGALRAATDHARRNAFNAYTAGAQLSPAQPGKA